MSAFCRSTRRFVWSRHIVRLMSFCEEHQYVRTIILNEGTHSHSELVVWEQPGHKVEEVLIVLAKNDSLERNLAQDGLQAWRELALNLPVLLRDRLLEHVNSLLQVRVEGVLQNESAAAP